MLPSDKCSDEFYKYAKTKVKTEGSLSNYIFTETGTILPVSDITGRIHGTYNIYGDITPGVIWTKNSSSKPFIPTVIIQTQKEIELRLRLDDLNRTYPRSRNIKGKIIYWWRVFQIWMDVKVIQKCKAWKGI